MDIQRKAITVLVVILAFLAFVPAGCSGLSNGNFGTVVGEKEIRLNITSPEDEDIIYFDVVPAYITVHGTIDASQGIRNVSITNGLNDTYGEVVCGSNYGTHLEISCEILITDHVTIIATDNSGFVVSETRNFTSHAGPPGPGTIWVTGWVIDPEGQPVPNASISFERMWENPPGIATTKSLADGSYKMKKTWGYFQKINVQKEGYQTFVRGAIFKIYNNELNLTLTPKGTSVPGFNFEVAISAILIGLLLVDVRKSR